MITVMGATGRTGSKVAAQLLHAGQPVRAVGRSAGRLAELADAGAEPVVGDAPDRGLPDRRVPRRGRRVRDAARGSDLA